MSERCWPFMHHWHKSHEVRYHDRPACPGAPDDRVWWTGDWHVCCRCPATRLVGWGWDDCYHVRHYYDVEPTTTHGG